MLLNIGSLLNVTSQIVVVEYQFLKDIQHLWGDFLSSIILNDDSLLRE